MLSVFSFFRSQLFSQKPSRLCLDTFPFVSFVSPLYLLLHPPLHLKLFSCRCFQSQRNYTTSVRMLAENHRRAFLQIILSKQGRSISLWLYWDQELLTVYLFTVPQTEKGCVTQTHTYFPCLWKMHTEWEHRNWYSDRRGFREQRGNVYKNSIILQPLELDCTLFLFFLNINPDLRGVLIIKTAALNKCLLSLF